MEVFRLFAQLESPLLMGTQVHFHMIPKPNQSEGLGIEWPAQKTDMDKLKEFYADLKAKI